MTAPTTTPPLLDDQAAAVTRARSACARVVRARLKPPPRLTVSQWADRYRILSPEASFRRGQFSTDAAPYQREPMDVIGDRRYRRVVLMWASQVGKTELVNNYVGYLIDQDPGPMLVIQPTLDMAETWSKDRLAPMLRDTPRLRNKVADARSRDSGNTMLHKSYPGGHITVSGANSPAGLASRPIRDLLEDEVDRYPPSAGAEGRPSAVAESRTATFPNAKVVKISSPTTRGESEIAEEYESSDQREYFVPCPHCGAEQTLKFGGSEQLVGLKWERGPDGALAVHYVCDAGCVIEEHDKVWMLAHGRWIPQNPEGRFPGFRLSALYSPFFSWTRLVERWLRDKSDPLKLQAFVNTILCELWDPVEGDEVQPEGLYARLGAGYPENGTVPRTVAVLTRSVDVQGDRLETAVWGWGEGEEAWLVEHELIPEDPTKPAAWRILDEIRERAYRTEDGAVLRPAVTFVDSGGHHAKEVYAYTRARQTAGVYAIKGASTEGAPLLGRPTRNNSAKAILYLVGSFTGKESLMRRLAKVTEPGPRYIHLPEWLDGEQIAQFTAERLTTKRTGGIAKRVWIKTRDRNEQIDLFVYALAALQKLGPGVTQHLGAIAQQQSEKAAASGAKAAAAPPPASPLLRPPAPRRSGFVKRY